VALSSARAVILLDTGDPAVNTSAPTGALANSGWQYEGNWLGLIGTPIAPSFFIAAGHIGGSTGNTLIYQGTSYTTVKSFSLSGSDLLIWQVNGTFPSFAPLYTNQDEIGKGLIVFGHGTQRGSEMYLNGTLRGWGWGPSDGAQRWGQNDVSSIVPYQKHDLLYATFDQHVLANDHPNECHLSRGDSSGGMFINDHGTWKLAGVIYGVDDLYTAPDANTQFTAAIFDARGYYTTDDGTTFTQITGANPIATGFYCSRISSELGWIESVIDPNSDLDGDGVPNILEYALHMNPIASDVTGLPQVGREGNFVTLTYTKPITATDVVYIVEESPDLISWMNATPQNQVVSTTANVQTIKASVDIGTAPQLFLRLRVTR
jgi:hypothetical protein